MAADRVDMRLAGNLHVRLAGTPDAGTDDAALRTGVRLEPGGRHHDLVLEVSDRRLPAPTPADVLWRATEQTWRASAPDLANTIGQRDARHAYAVLSGLTGPAGGTVAAATTSLPERAEHCPRRPARRRPPHHRHPARRAHRSSRTTTSTGSATTAGLSRTPRARSCCAASPWHWPRTSRATRSTRCAGSNATAPRAARRAFAEEFDVAQRRLRGNLPQAFVHALLLEAAAALAHPRGLSAGR
ncbi:hypothetical protein [Kitasatospora sp. NPDC048407]|uniref:hypothetical protein n=1 Tax=Kitasatospora sp. NPDC048407 TaxID=3364051 RepID=UPI003717484D